MGRRRKGSRLVSIAIMAAIAVVGAAAGAMGVWLAYRGQPVPWSIGLRPPGREPTVRQPAAGGLPAPAQPPAPSPQPPHPTATASFRVAIIFDDAGGSLDDVEKIIAIGRPVAVAVLPGLTYSADAARRARAAGLEVLLHLPVEAEDEVKTLGPGGVTVDMSDAEIRAAVRSGLASVPGAVGVNNHMGSRGTADRRVVRAILEVVRQERLFFIDSRTTRESVVGAVAADLGVRTAVRTVFLDNENEEDAIRSQLRRLIALARERGSAIAIGHAQRLTPGVLAGMLDEFDRAGLAIVPPSTLVR